tara:strand:- start:193 stop:801 length:609 start_codon:yes stop_codon:yes gene_type:complete
MNMRYSLRDFGTYVEDRATTLHWSAEDGLKCRCSCDVCQSQWWKPIQFLLGLHPVVQTLNRVTSDKHYRDEDFDAAYDKLQAIYQVRITDWLMERGMAFSAWCNSFYTEKTTWYFDWYNDDRDRVYYEASYDEGFNPSHAVEADGRTLLPMPRGEDVDVSNLPQGIMLYDTKPKGFSHLDTDQVWITDKYYDRTLHSFVEYL